MVDFNTLPWQLYVVGALWLLYRLVRAIETKFGVLPSRPSQMTAELRGALGV